MASTATSGMKLEVERHGTFFERRGMTPMEARVFALLLLADPPQMDFFAIRDYLDASKSAISNAINRLLSSKRIDYITQPGDRKRYFHVDADKWLLEMKQEIASVAPFVDIIDRILKSREGMDTPDFNEELERVRRFFTFLSDEFPQLMEKWERVDTKAAKK